MSNHCCECRFYDGKKCSATGSNVAAGSCACGRFSAYGLGKLEDVKHCRDCRFFDGKKCSATGSNVAAGSCACGRKAPAR